VRHIALARPKTAILTRFGNFVSSCIKHLSHVSGIFGLRLPACETVQDFTLIVATVADTLG